MNVCLSVSTTEMNLDRRLMSVFASVCNSLRLIPDLTPITHWRSDLFFNSILTGKKKTIFLCSLLLQLFAVLVTVKGGGIIKCHMDILSSCQSNPDVTPDSH